MLTDPRPQVVQQGEPKSELDSELALLLATEGVRELLQDASREKGFDVLTDLSKPIGDKWDAMRVGLALCDFWGFLEMEGGHEELVTRLKMLEPLSFVVYQSLESHCS